RIVNETDRPVEVKINFLESYEVPSIPGKYFKILIHPDTMKMENASKFNYGLNNLDGFLDENIHAPAPFLRTINPGESSSFCTLKLHKTSEGMRGGGDILRTGFVLKGQDLFYKISVYKSDAPPLLFAEEDFHCGGINIES